MTTTMGIVEWLRAQIDGDERDALEAEGNGQWECIGTGRLELGGIGDLDGLMIGPRGVIYHCERHDPARVLAEVQVKRRILDLHDDDGWGYCPMCVDPQDRDVRAKSPCEHLRILGTVYAASPGYRTEWAPQ